MTIDPPRDRQPSLYDRIGAEAIRAAVVEFYRRAFVDGIIGHFFMGKDHAQLIEAQVAFAGAMLGAPRGGYRGRPLEAVHRDLPIRRPHFGRRQRLMAEVLTELGLDPALREAWLALEEALRPLIIDQGSASCQPPKA